MKETYKEAGLAVASSLPKLPCHESKIFDDSTFNEGDVKLILSVIGANGDTVYSSFSGNYTTVNFRL